jgi:TusA-related sulfurtransferase
MVVPAKKTLDVIAFFNPVDCRSLGVIKDEMQDMAPGEVIEVTANRFQRREIHAWSKKFEHRIVEERDDQGCVRIWIAKGQHA